jgi:diaminopimelate epimerase
MGLRFTKMHGAGNDFMILDCRAQTPPPPERVRRMADRHRGVGFDQLIAVLPARHAESAFAYAVRNADGSEAGQCGNGARCVAAWLAREGLVSSHAFRMDGPSGSVDVSLVDARTVRVAMGLPDFHPAAVGLDQRPGPDGRYRLALDDGEQVEFAAVSMGNPHAVIAVAEVASAPVQRVGTRLGSHPAFAEGVNVGFVERVAPDHLRLRVFERGVGETLACGSAACAAAAVLVQRGEAGAHVRVELPGGSLEIDWGGPGSTLWMSGPVAFVFEGEWLDD